MGKPSKQLADFMATYKIKTDEVWEVRSGGAWAVKHAALERVAAERLITFDLPTVIEGDGINRNVALLVNARMGERSEWSIGEASPANNKNAYAYAMAEKRAKDRCILKLLNSHGALYSESEADEFTERRPVSSDDTPPTQPAATDAEAYVAAAIKAMGVARTEQDLIKWWGSEKRSRDMYQLSPDQGPGEKLAAAFLARKAELKSSELIGA